MYDVDPKPCTPAAFRAGERSGPRHGVVSRNEGHPTRRYLEASLTVGWGVRLCSFVWCDAVLLGLLHVGGCSSSGLEVVGFVLAGVQLLALLTKESDVDVTVLPNDHLLVTFSCPVRERCVTMPALSVRAVARVTDPENEHQTFRAHLLLHGRHALDLGTGEDTAARVATFLNRPLELYSPALPPDIQTGSSATLAADA